MKAADDADRRLDEILAEVRADKAAIAAREETEARSRAAHSPATPREYLSDVVALDAHQRRQRAEREGRAFLDAIVESVRV